MTIVIDIDDTLIRSKRKECDACGRMVYHDSRPINEEINTLNKLYDAGHIIILHTGRNWDCYNVTKKQLRKHNIKYHELVMGKPQGVYVDKDAITTLKDA